VQRVGRKKAKRSEAGAAARSAAAKAETSGGRPILRSAPSAEGKQKQAKNRFGDQRTKKIDENSLLGDNKQFGYTELIYWQL
jgi:hypothetical protein